MNLDSESPTPRDDLETRPPTEKSAKSGRIRSHDGRAPLARHVEASTPGIDAGDMNALFKPAVPAPKRSAILEFLRWLAGKPVLADYVSAGSAVMCPRCDAPSEGGTSSVTRHH